MSTPISAVRSAILRGETVDTELGQFQIRTYKRYEGKNPRTGEPVVVPGRHELWLLPSDRLLADVLGVVRERPSAFVDAGARFVSVADDYAAIVARLKTSKVTKVPDPYSWSDTEPKDPVPWHDLGWFAVFRGRQEEGGPLRSLVVFRPNVAIGEALSAALGA